MKLASMRDALEVPARRPWFALAIAAGLSLLAALALPGLRLDSSYFALLADNTPYVQDADHVRERTGGHRQLVVALSGLEREALDRVAEELSQRAERHEHVGQAYAALDTSFFDRRALWLMGDATLDELITAATTLVESARRPAFGDASEAERTIRRRALEQIAGIRASVAAERPDLELSTDDGRYRLVLIVPEVRVMDMDQSAQMMLALEQLVDEIAAEHPGLEARFTGKFALVLEHNRMLEQDVVVTSIVALTLCVLLVALFFRSWRAPPILGVAVVLAALWTLGIAAVTVGSLNAISTLLLPVLAGLGIDFGIHLATRYEQLRTSSPTPATAMIAAIRETRVPALTGALTTACAFLALTVAELQAFAELGGLTALGVLCSLLATYLVVPALLVLRDRSRPVPPSASETAASEDASPPKPRGRPSRLWLALALFCVALAAMSLRSAASLRFENDYRLLRDDSDSDAFFAYIDENLGVRFDPSVILLETQADLRGARATIERRRLESGSRIETVIGLDDFLPRHTETRERRVLQLRDLLADPMLDLTDDPRLAEVRELAAHDPWGISELPRWVRERFVARDGRASIMLLYGDEPIQSDHQALRWDEELGHLRAEFDDAGLAYTISSEALLPAWVYVVIRRDAPRLVSLAGAVVALLVLLHFVRARGLVGILHAAYVLVPLGAGLLWSVGIMGAAGMRLTMFNLVVFPCVIGIGVDDLVHLVHRHGATSSLRKVFSETGPTVVLTSLTTAAGFGATTLARHPGMANVGPAALIAIACTTLAAVVFLPSLLNTIPLEGRS